MPIEELLAIYRYEASVSTVAGSSVGSSPGELTDELPDMTLDKVSSMKLKLASYFFNTVLGICPKTAKSCRK